MAWLKATRNFVLCWALGHEWLDSEEYETRFCMFCQKVEVIDGKN